MFGDCWIPGNALCPVAALVNHDPLKMTDWHVCNTTHCITGWACHLDPIANELQKNLRDLNSSPVNLKKH